MICLRGCSEPSNHDIDGEGSPCAEQGILPPLEMKNQSKEQKSIFTALINKKDSKHHMKDQAVFFFYNLL